MTEQFPDAPEPVVDDGKPLEPWLMTLADEVTFPKTETVPRDMMWARMQRQRRDAVTQTPSDVSGGAPHDARPRTPSHAPQFAARTLPGRSWIARTIGIAAVLALGAGVGRYVLPVSGSLNPGMAAHATAQTTLHTDSIAALGLGPDALAALPYSNEPVRVAMEEHLGRTVALLMTVRDENPAYGASADISSWARELLSTTRMLIDEPQLSDDRTRRLLQDLELVLAQIVQARGSVPATQRAPGETMRETNLLPRVRAAATASRFGDDPTFGGDN